MFTKAIYENYAISAFPGYPGIAGAGTDHAFSRRSGAAIWAQFVRVHSWKEFHLLIGETNAGT